MFRKTTVMEKLPEKQPDQQQHQAIGQGSGTISCLVCCAAEKVNSTSTVGIPMYKTAVRHH